MVGPAGSIFRALCSAVSSSGFGRKLSILIYHRVLPGPNPLRPADVDRQVFKSQMEVLAKHFNPLPLGEAVVLRDRNQLPPRAVSITFDDGYADNESEALPILKSLGLSATFFVATGFIDGGRMWNDSIIEAVCAADEGILDFDREDLGTFEIRHTASRLHSIKRLLSKLKYLPLPERDDKVQHVIESVGKPLPDDLMMTSDQVKNLHAAGMEVGAHTVNHPILSTLPDEDARQEISGSRAKIENIVGSAVNTFAYPNGTPGTDYSRRDVDLVRDLGFTTAVSTAWGVARPSTDSLQLPRFTPWDRSKHRFALRLMQNYGRSEPSVV